MIDGQPVFVYETEEGYEKIPFSMSDLGDYAYADGQKVPLKTQGNSILVPTEEGLVSVPIEEFDVVMVDGQIVLIAEENPIVLGVPKWFIAYQLVKMGVISGAAIYAGVNPLELLTPVRIEMIQQLWKQYQN